MIKQGVIEGIGDLHMDGTMLVVAGVACLSGLGTLGPCFYRRLLNSIPIRIHVNGMCDRPEPGVTTVYQVRHSTQSLLFVNSFAANDPDAAGRIWETIVQRYGQNRWRVAIINCRHDRADRSLQLAEACVQWTPADHYIVTGTGTELFHRSAARLEIGGGQVTTLEKTSRDRVLKVIDRVAGPSALRWEWEMFQVLVWNLLSIFIDRTRIQPTWFLFVVCCTTSCLAKQPNVWINNFGRYPLVI